MDWYRPAAYSGGDDKIGAPCILRYVVGPETWVLKVALYSGMIQRVLVNKPSRPLGHFLFPILLEKINRKMTLLQ